MSPILAYRYFDKNLNVSNLTLLRMYSTDEDFRNFQDVYTGVGFQRSYHIVIFWFATAKWFIKTFF